MENNNRFEEIYSKLEQNDFSSLENKRRKAYKGRNLGKTSTGITALAFFLILPFGFMFIFFASLENGADKVFSPEASTTTKYILLAMIISVLVLIIRYLRVKAGKNKEKQYRKSYISEFNETFIKLINPNYSYNGEKGILEKNYKLVDLFPYEDYRARGLISGNLSNGYNFKAGQVTTWSSREVNDKRIKFVKFDGIFYEIDLPFSINSKLYLRSDKNLDDANFIKKLFNADGQLTRLKVKMDSEEFENVFDVYAENRVLAMQIFTADVMVELMRIYSITSNKFEITIDKNKLYIKFDTGAIFKAPGDLNIEVLNKDILHKYFKRFESTLKISEKFIEIIQENNIS